MKYSGNELQTEYFDLLDGNISYSGNTVPVYDTVPKDATYPYIKLSERTALEDSTKTTFGEEVTQQVQVVDRFDASFGSRDSLYSIGNDIIEIIVARPVPLTLTNWHVITSTLDDSNTVSDYTDTHEYKYLNLRFRHILEEK